MTDGHGRNQLLISLDRYLKDGSVLIEEIENLILTSDLKHPDLYLGHMDTLMSYFYHGQKSLPLSPGALEHLLFNSNLHRINLQGQNALLIALDNPQEHYSCVPYLVENSNIFTQEIQKIRPYQTINAFTKIFDLYAQDVSYTLEMKIWERLFTTEMMKNHTGSTLKLFQDLKKDLKEYILYEKFRNHLECTLEKKEATKKIKI